MNINANDVEIARSTQVLAQVTNALESCPSRTYVVVRQEGVSSADYRNDDGLSWLGRYMSGYNSEVKSTLAVPEMLESADASVGVTEYLQNKCGVQVLEVKGAEISTTEAPARTASPLLIYVSMAAPPSGSLRPFNLNALGKTMVSPWALLRLMVTRRATKDRRRELGRLARLHSHLYHHTSGQRANQNCRRKSPRIRNGGPLR